MFSLSSWGGFPVSVQKVCIGIFLEYLRVIVSRTYLIGLFGACKGLFWLIGVKGFLTVNC